MPAERATSTKVTRLDAVVCDPAGDPAGDASAAARILSNCLLETGTLLLIYPDDVEPWPEPVERGADSGEPNRLLLSTASRDSAARILENHPA